MRLAILALFLTSCGVTFESLEQALARALPATGGGDCADAERLRDTICDLAKEYCDRAERAQDDATAQARCVDSKERCERARAFVSERCARGMVDDRR
ncbi:MAG: hypothetical protein IT381_18125 [Deltaproteobacteria bacterium]|nr:hypothetical protein [Deltaproteobacteria bacterium]